MVSAYPHMCRMDHIEIGHKDSEREQCPLCRVVHALEHLINDKDTTYAVRVSRARDALASVSNGTREGAAK